MSLSPIFRDCLVRYQQTAIRETGRRPVTLVRPSVPEDLLLPGCSLSGASCWQPMPWKDGCAPLGPHAQHFHPSIVQYLSLCQFLEIRFTLPVMPSGSPLSFLYRRVLEALPNTELSPPSRAFDQAEALHQRHSKLPLALCMAASCDGGEPVLLMLQASDGQAFLLRPTRGEEPLFLKIGLDRLLPKLRFVYDTSGERVDATALLWGETDNPPSEEPATEPKAERIIAQYAPYRYACDFFEPSPITRQRMRLAQLYYEGNPFISDLWLPWQDVNAYVDKRRHTLDVRALCEGFQIAPATDPAEKGGLYPNRIRVVNVCDLTLSPLAADTLNNPAYGSGLSPLGTLNRLICLPGSEQLLQDGRLKEEACSLTCENLQVPEADFLRMRALAEWQEHKGRLIDAMHQRETTLSQMQLGTIGYERARDVLNAKVDRLLSLIRIAPPGYVQPSGYDADIDYLRRKALHREGDPAPFQPDPHREARIESGFAMRSSKGFALSELYVKPERESTPVPAAKADASHRMRASNGQWFEQINMFSTLNP